MITSYHHVELNGVKYRLAEAAEGKHYIEAGEPLRPPNAQVIQGANNTFQLRPDTLAWRLGSWSGGAGQILFDSNNPTRTRQLHNVDPFTDPGSLHPGFYHVAYNEGLDAALDFNTQGSDQPWATEGGSDMNLHQWDPDAEEWVERDTGATGGGAIRAIDYAPGQAVTQPAFGAEATEIWYIDFAGTVTSWCDSIMFPGNGREISTSWLLQLGDYIYFETYNAAGSVFGVGELSAVTQPSDSDDIVLVADSYPGTVEAATRSANRGYLATKLYRDCVVYELTPSSAASTASIAPVLTIPGETPAAAMFTGGTLLLPMISGAIYYWRPSGEYGLLKARPDPEEETWGGKGIKGDHFASSLGFAVFYYVSDWTDEMEGETTGRVLMIDTVNGAWAWVGYFPDHVNNPTNHLLLVPRGLRALDIFDGQAYWTNQKRDTGTGSSAGYALSPWYDFGVAGSKELMSVRVEHDLADGQPVSIYARIDGDDDTETLVGTITGDGTGPATTTLIPSSGLSFSRLSLRVTFDTYTATYGADDSKIMEVEARAAVTQEQKIWQLMLDCYDDETGVHGSTKGETKLENVTTLAKSGAPFTFKDGYKKRGIGSTSYTVVVDSHNLDIERPGEGLATVVLREVS